MEDMGYNAAIIETDAKDPDLPGLFDIMDKHGLDAVIIDRSWSNDTSSSYHYAPTALSAANYNLFEAEFAGASDVKPGDGYDSYYWYASHKNQEPRRVGEVKSDPMASYGHSWYVKRGEKPGYAYTDLKYRWPNRGGALNRVGRAWYVYQTNAPSFKDQYFYIRYRFKIENLKPGLTISDTLLTFSPSGFTIGKWGYNTIPIELKHKQQKDESTARFDTYYTVANLKSNASGSQYITVELKLAYTDMIETGLLSANLDGNAASGESKIVMKLENLNPRLWWHGNCDLYLDYIEYEDQLHYDMRLQRDLYKDGINRRVRDLQSMTKGNFAGIYTHDEPFQGQLQTYGLIEDLLAASNVDIFTAVYDFNYRQRVIDKNKDLFYEHLENFRKSAQPKIIATDIYPISPDLDWNSAPRGDDSYLFLQNTLDVKLHKEYRDAKLYAIEKPGRKFYPIVQTFGRWGLADKSAQWTGWIRPPLATQKMLNFFPLCYGPNGVFHYRVQSFQDEAEYGDHCALKVLGSGGVYGKPQIDRITYQAIQETNPKLQLYGNILSDYKWIDAEKVMTSGTKSRIYLEAMGLNKLRVENSSGLYQGYIQVGYYLADKHEAVIMAVNRRANYFKSGKIKDPKLVPPAQFEQYFPEAEAQNLIFEFSDRARKQYGSPALLDPADGSIYAAQNLVVSVPIGAGEAKLLQVIASLPKEVSVNTEILGNAILQGEIELSKKARLTLKDTSKVVMKPGTTMIIRENAQMTVEGELELKPGAIIIVQGKLNNKGRIKAAEGAVTYEIIEKRSFWQKLFGKKTKS